ncbi:hypothetical protein D3963_003358 [Escherichia coli]|nr:hypothetical protein [Escherichia coli]
MTMLLPLFILVGFIAGYFVNAIAYHLSPLEDKTALTFRQVLVHFCNQVNHLIPTRVLVKGGEITCKILK